MTEKKSTRNAEGKTRSKGRPSKDAPKLGVEVIVNSARSLIRQHRAVYISRAEVAKMADVDEKLIRYYFKNYEDLIDQALDIDIAELEEAMTKASRPQKTATRALRNRINALISFLLENPTVFKTLVEHVYTRETPTARNRLESLNKGAYERHYKIVSQGWETGEFHKDFDPRLLYVAIIGMAEFFNTGRPVVEYIFGADAEDVMARYQRFVCDLVLYGISTTQKKSRKNPEDRGSEEWE